MNEIKKYERIEIGKYVKNEIEHMKLKKFTTLKNFLMSYETNLPFFCCVYLTKIHIKKSHG